MGRQFLFVMLCLPVVTPAASFSLGAVLRAGGGPGVATPELSLGSTSSASVTSAEFFPYWLNSTDHAFALSYNASTNNATLTASWLGIFDSTLIWNVAGGSASSAQRTWTIGAGGITLTAENLAIANTSISVHSLQLTGPGIGIINPPALVAAQTGSGTVSASNSSPITFTTPTGSGSWILTGQIRFSGFGLFGPGAEGDQLRAAFDITASDVPEPESLLLSALGFAALGVLRHFRARRRTRLASAIKTPALR